MQAVPKFCRMKFNTVMVNNLTNNNSLNIKNNITVFDFENPCLDLGQAKTCGSVKPVNVGSTPSCGDLFSI